MQINEVLKIVNKINVQDWLEYHPDNSENRRKNRTNTIYVAKHHLSWNSQLPGAGSFEFNEKLALTTDGLTRSKWCLPDFFRATEISYQAMIRGKKDTFNPQLGTRNSY